jgi:two-component system, OmpR family, sensor histidine kinase ChvG
MNLKRQLLLVSLLTLVLPWAGVQFIRETETALREVQQQMLAGTAQAIADSLAQFPDEFLKPGASARFGPGQVYAHPLEREPLLDGYYDDWTTDAVNLRDMRGVDGPVRYVFATWRSQLWFYVEVPDSEVLYANAGDSRFADQVSLFSVGTQDENVEFRFAPEAPGRIVARRDGGSVEQRVAAHWQDTPSGFQLEGRIPLQMLGDSLGLTVFNAREGQARVRSSTFSGAQPGRLVMPSALLQSVLRGYVQDGLRLLVTDRDGWRLAASGNLSAGGRQYDREQAGWLRLAYNAILEPGEEAELAEPDPSGREQQGYIEAALNGSAESSWFRAAQTGRAVVAVAQPVWSGNVQTGAVVLQQGTDAILSLRSTALSRLMSFTLIATLVAAGALLGYASWLSQRVRRLSRGARRALDDNRAHAGLPSLAASDEIGDLSRSFASVLKQLGDYNEYLRSLASKLSHELRTPLTIVRSSLDNLEHENLSADGRQYTGRARDGVERLKGILNAMSEANRIEELVQNAELELFDLHDVLTAAISAYAAAWPQRQFLYDSNVADSTMSGAPELIVQMLDKLIDNAIDFSAEGDAIGISLGAVDNYLQLVVSNPGPPLPEKMRGQLFDSMISVRDEGKSQHLGLGLFIARIIAEGHGGLIAASNTENGVAFSVSLGRSQVRI